MFSELYIVHFNHFSIPRCGDQTHVGAVIMEL